MDKVDHGTVTATGAGAMTGQATSTFTLTFRNGTAAPVDLASVVVQAVFGQPPQSAPPVYDESTQDFAVVLQPQTVASSRYAFAIPTDAFSQVSLTVDFDGQHLPAVFVGALH